MMWRRVQRNRRSFKIRQMVTTTTTTTNTVEGSGEAHVYYSHEQRAKHMFTIVMELCGFHFGINMHGWKGGRKENITQLSKACAYCFTVMLEHC